MEGVRQSRFQVAHLACPAWAGLAWVLAVPLAASERLKDFQERFAQGGPEVRVAAVEDLVEPKDLADTQKVVHAAFDDPESVVNLAAVRLLARLKDGPSIDWLLQTPLKSGKMQVRYLAVETLARLDDPRVPAALSERLADASWLVAASAARGLAARKANPEAPKILALLRHKDQRVRVAAVDALAELGCKEALPELLRLLESDKEWRVRSAVCDALRLLKAADALPQVRKLMQGAEGRLKDDLRRTAQALQEGGAGGEELKGYGLQYHGIGTSSQRLLFIVDCSESMKHPIGNSAKTVELEEGCEATKLGVCQSELIRALQQLQKEGGKFNMIFVHSQNDVWEKALMPATPEQVTRAIKHIKRQTPTGRTNLCDALAFALMIEDGGAVDLTPEDMKDTPDTVFLLSDGDPNEGKFKRPSDILESVREFNRYARVRIHGIGTGEARFLKDLAGQNGGVFVSKVEF